MHGGDATPGHLTHAERGRGEHANRAVCLHVVSVAKGSRAPHSAALPGGAAPPVAKSMENRGAGHSRQSPHCAAPAHFQTAAPPPPPARAPLEPDFWHDCLSISEPVRPPRSARQSENPCHTHTHTHTHTLTQGKPKAHGPLARNAFSQISRRALPVPAKGIKAPPRPPPSPNFSSCISHPLRHQPHTAHQQHTRNIINNGPHQADRSQVHWWQGSSQAACLQGW